MTGILEQLRTVAKAMNQLETKWAMIGGLAISVRTAPRTTRDIDLAVMADTPSRQETFIKQLKQLGFFGEQLILHAMLVAKLGIRLMVPAAQGTSLPVDLLFSSSGIEPEVVLAADKIEVFPKLFIPVATRAHLLAMKVISENDADRIQDRQDIRELLKDAKTKDIEAAKAALLLVKQRGFDRGKNLEVCFDELLRKFASK